MKGLFVTVAIALMANTASAYTLGIVDLEEPTTSTDAYVAFGDDGQIYEISQSNTEAVKLAKSAMADHVKVEVEFSENEASENLLEMRNEILKISLTSMAIEPAVLEAAESHTKDLNSYASIKNSYITDFDTEQEAATVFYSQRKDTRNKSQCFNRAHVWSWEMSRKIYKGRRIQPGKIWIFFTSKYIREYRHKWWFHISPYVKVQGENRIMDRSFNERPTTEKGWTDKFIRSKQACPEVVNYSDYRNNQWAAHCYVMKSSLFYWQPRELDYVERRNKGKDQWIKWEVRAAYNNAIGNRSTVAQ